MLILLKGVFSDIICLYKNFGHWILSKITISFFRYLLTFLFVLPLITILIIVVIVSPYSFLEYETIIQDILIVLYPLGNNFLGFSIWNFIITLLLLAITILGLVAVFYNRILLAKLNLAYIDGKKLEYKKNLYFNKTVFIKYLKISGLFIGSLFIFAIIFGIGSLILFFMFGGMGGMESILNNSGNNNGFSIASFVYLIVCSVVFLYVIYRLVFSFFILVENDKKTVKQSIIKSFKITSGYNKLFKFLGVLFIFYVIYIPFSYTSQVIDFNAKSISYYVGMKDYVGEGQASERLNGDEFYAFTQLQQQYGGYSDQEIIGKEKFMVIMQWMYTIFHFVFLYGIFDMLLVSFYRRELLKK